MWAFKKIWLIFWKIQKCNLCLLKTISFIPFRANEQEEVSGVTLLKDHVMLRRTNLLYLATKVNMQCFVTC